MSSPAGTHLVFGRPRLERITDVSAFSALQEEWDELLQTSDSDCMFLSWEWLYTWWQHLAGDRQLSILTVRQGDRLIAVAPLAMRSPSLYRRRPLPVLEFLGNGSVGSDYLDFIVRRGFEEIAFPAVAAHLTDLRLMLDWAQLRRGNCLASGVAACLKERRWSISETKTNTCPFIRLAGMTWEDYLGTLGSEHRYNFRRKLARLKKEFKITFEPVREAEECRESIDVLMELHNMRWRDRGGSDAFHTPGLMSFHRQFAPIALKRGWLRLFVLRLNDTPVACIYGFLYGKTFYFYQSGFDTAYSQYSVGLVSMGLAIKHAIEEGAEEYDLLHGNEEYKSHWSRKSRELGRMELYPPGGLGRICRSSAEFEKASRRFARRVLPRSMFL